MAGDNTTQFAIAAPQIHSKFPIERAEIERYVARSEALKFHSLWVQEQAGLRAGAGAVEGVSMLSYLAALTRTVRLGSAVFLINLRNPIQLAKSLASLDQLSGGRLIVGVGLGAVTRLYQAYGLSPEHRVARFNEALTLIQKLWSEEEVNFEGRFWQVQKASLLPKPVQKPHPPVWFGGGAPPALKRAAKRGSGFIGAGSASTADFKAQVELLRAALIEEKKEPGSFTIAKRVYIAVDQNRDRAQSRTREWFGLYYGRAEMADRVAVWGNREECAAQLKEIIDAGTRLVLLNPMFDMHDQMETLAADVIPRLKPKN